MPAKIILLAFANLVISVDYNIVYVALPSIGHDVGLSPPSLQWVVSAYAVGFGGFLLLGGRAVDRLGARRMFVLALLLFGLASLAGGFAPTPGVLIGARARLAVGVLHQHPAHRGGGGDRCAPARPGRGAHRLVPLRPARRPPRHGGLDAARPRSDRHQPGRRRAGSGVHRPICTGGAPHPGAAGPGAAPTQPRPRHRGDR